MAADTRTIVRTLVARLKDGVPFPHGRLAEVRDLAARLDAELDLDEDYAARNDLGWLHFFLHAYEQGEKEQQEALMAALGCFALSRLSGVGDVPRALDALMGMAVSMRAQRFFMAVLEDPGPDAASRAVTGIDRLIRLAGADHPDRDTLVSSLCAVLQLRLGVSDDPVEAARAVEVLDPLLNDATPAGVWLVHGLVLSHRFDHTADLRDANRAIASLRRGITLLPADHPDRAGSLSNLATVLMLRFEQTWSLADLDASITLHQQVITAITADEPNAAAFLLNLGAALTARFERSGALTDVDAAVEWLRDAVGRATPGGEVHRRALTTLGGALLLRYRRESRIEDNEEALRHAKQARRLTPADHPDHPLLAYALGALLHCRFEQHPAYDVTDLDRAVDLFRQAVDATAPAHPSWPEYVLHLTTALQQRYDRTRDARDPARSVELLRRLLARTEPGGPRHTLGLVKMGTALTHIGAAATGRDEARAAFAGAVRCLTAAADAPTGQTTLRIDAARLAALYTSVTDPALGARLLAQAVELLPEAAPRFIHRRDQQHALGGFSGLAGDAAALTLAARAGDPGRSLAALRLLESGRALLLSQLLETRDDLTALRERRPELADRYEHLRRLLDTDEVGRLPAELLTRPDAAPELDTRQRLLREFGETVAAIRALDGFASFMLPPAAQSLFRAADEGPVVVFTVSRYGSGALLLTTTGVDFLPLPGLTPGAVAHRTEHFRAVVTASADDDPAVSVAAQRDLTALLEWLWDAATGPVLDALGLRAPGDGATGPLPRLWWSPGGLLGQLPLHAAGYHQGEDAAESRTVMDRVVSSYTPTVQALLHARRPTVSTGGPGRAVVVAMPTTPGHPDLHRALDEADAVSEQLGLPYEVFASPDESYAHGTGAAPTSLPTSARVLDALGSASVVHLICHGISEAADPSHSRLLLHDHREVPFTVLSLAPVNLDSAELAYLSACETAVSTHDDLADESIHLASAFQLMGFRQVIGTLWKAYDDESDEIASAFYRGLAGPDGTLDCGRSAVALHGVIRERRDAFPRTPSLWAAYLHVGA
ncbi:CHAT domain-containing protein [Streptomyces sp. NPDC056144]|uniref:CHAT domain-containing protein n=1 Tax=unclassified Streptomyces TaxID=2593676 RepID=UPI0035D57D3E